MFHPLCQATPSRMVLMVLLLLSTVAHGQTDRFVATTGTDAGNCTVNPCATIGYALGVAASGDRIDIAAGTYTESITIAKDITLRGAGRLQTIVQAHALPDVANQRVMTVSAPPIATPAYQVAISRLTVRHGVASGPAPGNRGGGIYNDGNRLTLEAMNIEHNRAQYGGGIHSRNNHDSTLRNMNFRNNQAYVGNGGGMYNFNSSPAYHSVSFENNEATGGTVVVGRGGGVSATSGSSPSFVLSEFVGNSAEQRGGGLSVDNGSSATLTRSLFDGNSAGAWGGGVFQDGSTLTALRTDFVGNSSGTTGGGIRADGVSLELANTLFSGNAGSYGGGLYTLQGETSMVNALLVDNVAQFGGAISHNATAASHINTTFSNNSATSGGAILQSDGSLVLTNSIVWGNSGQSPGLEIVNSGGNAIINIDHSLVALGCPASSTCSNLIAGDPLFLDPGAGDYSLQAASPAVVAGDPATSTSGFPVNASGVAVDLVMNPRFANGRIDLGAFERQGTVLPLAPQLLEPADDQVNLPRPVTVIWQALDEVAEYQLQVVHADGSFSSPLTDEVIPVTEFELTGLEALTEYQWRVRARSGADHGPWSATWHFVTDMGITPGPGNIVYVDPSASGRHDGSAWENAINELAYVMRYAHQARNLDLWGPANPLQVWVASGTYKPQYRADYIAGEAGDSPHNAFVLVRDVQLYGGFSGIETSVDERDPRANPTILSGNNEFYHVVVSAGAVGVARLDGFRITGGAAFDDNSGAFLVVNGQHVYQNSGAGLYVTGSSPVLANLRIHDNSAGWAGAGVHVFTGSPYLLNVSVLSNQVTGGYGAGLSNVGGWPVIRNSLFAGNQAHGGGGGAVASRLAGSVLAVNLTLADNTALLGGAVYAESAGLTVHNAILWGNSATLGHQAYVDPEGIVAFDHVLHAAGANETHSDGTFTSTSPVHADPLFEPAVGNFMLQVASPAISAGSNALYSDSGGDLVSDVDLAGQPRRINGVIDLGAYEFQGAAGDAIFSDRFSD